MKFRRMFIHPDAGLFRSGTRAARFTAGRFSFMLIDIRGATEGIAHVDLVCPWHCGRGRSRRRRSPVLDNALDPPRISAAPPRRHAARFTAGRFSLSAASLSKKYIAGPRLTLLAAKTALVNLHIGPRRTVIGNSPAPVILIGASFLGRGMAGQGMLRPIGRLLALAAVAIAAYTYFVGLDGGR